MPKAPPQVLWPIAIVWFSVGIAGAAFRTVVLVQREDRQGPDVVVLAYVVFAFAIFILPLISTLNLSDRGATVEFQKQAAEVSDEVSQRLTLAVTDVATLLGRWLALQNLVQWEFTVPGFAATKPGYTYAVQVASAAMIESAAWIFAPADLWRITMWQVVPSQRALVFAFGVGRGEPTAVGTALSDPVLESLTSWAFYLPDDPFVGDAWQKGRLGNYAAVPATFRPPRVDGSRPYQAAMFVPVFRDARRWGVMIVEREAGNRYNDSAEVVASALSSFVGSVMSYPLAEYPPG